MKCSVVIVWGFPLKALQTTGTGPLGVKWGINLLHPAGLQVSVSFSATSYQSLSLIRIKDGVHRGGQSTGVNLSSVCAHTLTQYFCISEAVVLFSFMYLTQSKENKILTFICFLFYSHP